MNCDNCNKEHNGDYGSGRFCTSKCARGFSTKAKRKEINKKVSETLKKERIILQCKNCGSDIETSPNKIRKYCSNSCAAKGRWKKPSYRKHITNLSKKRCESLNERLRMQKIGRKGGFGKRGMTKGGTNYQSKLEKSCFEYLEDNDYDFIPHPNIPNTSKISDVYIKNLNLWVEIDGIDRNKRKDWLGKNYDRWINKLKLYEKYKFNLKIVKSLGEFIEIFTKTEVQ